MAQRRFTFGLERVRVLREHTESQAKEQLAATLSQRLRGAALLAQATERLNQADEARRPQPGAVGSAQDFLAHERWLHALERDRQAAEAGLVRLDAEVASRRSALGEASRDRGVLEKLKDRKREEFQREAARREGAELDELAITRHIRRAS